MVRAVAAEVAGVIAAVPPWQADWPECQVPVPALAPRPAFPVFQP
ncbi:hypothetical protein APASM_3864 [Actinosynnema pretiosum subsp. pretiosum]|nr:hypothetical protein APASM_3864 [Actinosynnema pretiosum subsp. pretiosum]